MSSIGAIGGAGASPAPAPSTSTATTTTTVNNADGTVTTTITNAQGVVQSVTITGAPNTDTPPSSSGSGQGSQVDIKA